MVLATLSCALLLAQTLEEERAIALARRMLAAELRVHEEAVTFSGVQPVEWPSARLGCDDAGESDLRAPVPGFRILFRAPDGVYAVHVGKGSAIVCAGPLGRSAATAAQDREDREPAVALPEEPDRRERVEGAISDLIARTATDRDAVEFLGLEKVVWSDRSLGCPRPGLMYAQVLTEGYRARLRVGKRVYAYHGGLRGELAYCERPSEPAPPH